MSGRHIDERLIEGCRRGDREAFRALFEACGDRVYSVCLHMLRGDEAAARDLTQQIFVDLFTTIGQFRGASEVTTWLHRLTVNACLDELRRRRRLVPLEEARLEEAPSPEDRAAADEAGDRARAIAAAVSKLRPKIRIAILLKHVEDLSYEEMAKVLRCAKGTVASRLNRGHRILARRLAHLRGPARGRG